MAEKQQRLGLVEGPPGIGKTTVLAEIFKKFDNQFKRTGQFKDGILFAALGGNDPDETLRAWAVNQFDLDPYVHISNERLSQFLQKEFSSKTLLFLVDDVNSPGTVEQIQSIIS